MVAGFGCPPRSRQQERQADDQLEEDQSLACARRSSTCSTPSLHRMASRRCDVEARRGTRCACSRSGCSATCTACSIGWRPAALSGRERVAIGRNRPILPRIGAPSAAHTRRLVSISTDAHTVIPRRLCSSSDQSLQHKLVERPSEALLHPHAGPCRRGRRKRSTPPTTTAISSGCSNRITARQRVPLQPQMRDSRH